MGKGTGYKSDLLHLSTGLGMEREPGKADQRMCR